ncbi:hypothetical protein ABZX92_19420 [Lentzea sp. NPDC006480]|uniref:hypothetical protein n=1 Tax=Lentzea sp. NPDC006480 TaxID=3157176 RepID=UPI0033BC7046
MTRLVVALCLLLVSCGVFSVSSSAVPTTTSSAASLDSSAAFSIALSTCPADLSRCTPARSQRG